MDCEYRDLNVQRNPDTISEGALFNQPASREACEYLTPREMVGFLIEFVLSRCVLSLLCIGIRYLVGSTSFHAIKKLFPLDVSY